VLNALILGGANSAVQWYCAPASGHIEAISPSDKASAIVPVIDSNIPQTKAAGPPFIKPGANPLAMDSHDANNVTDKARMESEPNFLSMRCFPLVLFDDVPPPPALLRKAFLSLVSCRLLSSSAYSRATFVSKGDSSIVSPDMVTLKFHRTFGDINLKYEE
jgi:hypothetical protein